MERKEDISGEEFLEMAMRAGDEGQWVAMSDSEPCPRSGRFGVPLRENSFVPSG